LSYQYPENLVIRRNNGSQFIANSVREYLKLIGGYLELIAKEFITNAQSVYDTWRPEGENYVQRFVDNETTSIKDSFNKIYNGIFKN
jgi:hypothetical protein